MKIVIMSAGECSRLPDAPYGNKSLVEVAGQRVIDWQMGAMPPDAEVTVVCRTSAAHKFPQDVEIVVDDDSYGPTRGLLHACPEEAFTVIFADTLFDRLPETQTAWVGIGLGMGGRTWEFHNNIRYCRRAHVIAGLARAVHCGIYRFDDPDKVRWIAEQGGQWHTMLTDYGFERDEIIEGWLDTGDEDALARAEKALSEA